MLSIVGKKLEENTKDKRRLEGYFVILEKWSKSKVPPLPPLTLLLAATVQSHHRFPLLQAWSVAG